ncbi:permease-like cell division protein FtsX [Ferrimonas lipolytica]|uniref:Cell division protein FtsX n=1 Tax=Ferrimonas lipolytica TaxID=2724191 RepID=A0A6H1UKC0_9GAMM|nr:permease-like cell division protein FtsX [Ferrimonas lipolytica]QIZ78252.1 cell division protein FtsX [Ferrimonas lipolytica]
MKRTKSKVSTGRRFSSFLGQHAKQLVASLGELWQTPMTSVMTMLVLGFSLSLPTLLLALSNNAAKVEQQWQHSSQINLFLQLDLPAASEQRLLSKLRGMAELIEVEHQSSQQALAEFQAHSRFADALQYLDDNPLPAVVKVVPSLNYRSGEAVKVLQQQLQSMPEVSLARLDLDWLERLQAFSDTAKRASSALSLLLIVAVVLITANTIRMGIMQRFHEIKVMKLVGATEAFIRRPFLYSGLWLGLMSAMLALVLVNGLLLWLDSAVAQLLSLYDSQLRLDGLTGSQVAWLLGCACGLGWLGAYVSVRRHLRAIEPQ